MPSRRHVHTRSIRVDAFARDDGLWDLEAVLVDTKYRDFPLATGVRKAGDPVHEMVLTVTIDTRLNVLAAHAESKWVPYPGHCDAIGPDYEKLVGLNLLQNFRRHVHARLGSVHGCSHITELAGVLPTAAVQAFADEVFKTRDTAFEAHHEETPSRGSWTAATPCAVTDPRSRSSIPAGTAEEACRGARPATTDSDEGRDDTMKIHEYQGKELFRRYGVPVPRGIPAFSVDEAVKAAESLGGPVWVVKAQIHAGGRGKGGGVKLARSLDEVRKRASEILGMQLVTHQTGAAGQKVRRLLVEEGADIKKELYVGMVVDRATQRVTLMASSRAAWTSRKSPPTRRRRSTRSTSIRRWA